MAYKFQIGTAYISGNIELQPDYDLLVDKDSVSDLGTSAKRFANAYVDSYYGDGSNLTGISSDSVDVTGSNLADALMLVGAQTASANGVPLAVPTSDGSTNPSNALLTFKPSTGLLSGSGAINANSLSLNGAAAISNQGAISGVTSIDASGDLTVGSITNAEFTVDSAGNTDIDGTLNVEGVPTFQAAAVFSSGITTAGAIAGASTIDASGLASLDGGINTNDDFTVDTDGNVVGVAGTFSGLASLDGGINTNDDFTVDTDGNVVGVAGTLSGLASLDGGINVNDTLTVSTAGAVAGATTISGSGQLAGEKLLIQDGATIGIASDADLLTLAAQSITVAADSSITYGGTAITSTGAELNLVDGSSAGTVVNSKAVIYGAAGQVNGTTVSGSGQVSGKNVVIQDGATIGPASVTDIMTFNADGDIVIKNGTYDFNIASHDGTNGLALGGTIVGASANEINYLQGVSAGTAAPNAAVVLDGSKNIATIGTVGCGAITSTGASSFGSISGVGNVTSTGNLSGSGFANFGGDVVVGTGSYYYGDGSKLTGISADSTDATGSAFNADMYITFANKLGDGITLGAGTIDGSNSGIGVLGINPSSSVMSLQNTNGGTFPTLTISGAANTATSRDGDNEYDTARLLLGDDLSIIGTQVDMSGEGGPARLPMLRIQAPGSDQGAGTIFLSGSGVMDNDGYSGLMLESEVNLSENKMVVTNQAGDTTLVVNPAGNLGGNSGGVLSASNGVAAGYGEFTGARSSGGNAILAGGAIRVRYGSTNYAHLGSDGEVSGTAGKFKYIDLQNSNGNGDGNSIMTDGTIRIRYNSTNYAHMSASGQISSSAGFLGKKVSLQDGQGIGNDSVGDLLIWSADGDATFKDGAYDVNIASHDGTNGLKLAGTLVTSDASELNLVDGSSAGSIVNSKALIYGSSGEVNGTSLDVGAAEIGGTLTFDAGSEQGIVSTAQNLTLRIADDKTGTNGSFLIWKSPGNDFMKFDTRYDVVEVKQDFSASCSNVFLGSGASAAVNVVGRLDIGSGVRYDSVAVKTTTATLDNQDSYVICQGGGSAFTVTLPASPTNGEFFAIKRASTMSADLTISGNGNNIDGQSTIILESAGAAVSVVYDSTGDQWNVF